MSCKDCNNKGWVNSYSYGSVNHPDGYYIQHCGSCNRFKSDKEVMQYIDLNCGRNYLGDTDAYRTGFADGVSEVKDYVQTYGE